MNERIKELLAKTNIPLFPLFPGKDPAWVATDRDMEKFAELIVKDCAEAIEDVHSKELGDYLKKVFRVE